MLNVFRISVCRYRYLLVELGKGIFLAGVGDAPPMVEDGAVRARRIRERCPLPRSHLLHAQLGAYLLVALRGIGREQRRYVIVVLAEEREYLAVHTLRPLRHLVVVILLAILLVAAQYRLLREFRAGRHLDVQNIAHVRHPRDDSENPLAEMRILTLTFIIWR